MSIERIAAPVAVVEEIGETTGGHGAPTMRATPALVLTALGIVFGDIGTSPLYALQVAIGAVDTPTTEVVMGAVSLTFWALALIISIKYVLFVLKADNRGEGGILALASSLERSAGGNGKDGALPAKPRHVVALLGLCGAALLYGDGIITPAVSVLSALEGMKVAAPQLGAYVLPLTVAVLVGLFAIQSRGTEKIGAVFGPVMFLWFIVIGALGLLGILENPVILTAIDPRQALGLVGQSPGDAALIAGGVFLTVTGGEALYADMGHVGRVAIQRAWYIIAMPALLLNYFGQGAAILGNPKLVENPFYGLAPSWAVIPLVLLSTAATIIASQAVISGVFSLTRQAMQLGNAPRMRVVQTSGKEFGQIYVPMINWLLMILAIALALTFKSSDNLAAAYGIAVSGTMLITAILLYFAMREKFGWSIWVAAPLCGFFALIDAFFLGANMTKLLDGGWLPLVVGAVSYFLMSTWARGTEAVARRMSSLSESFPVFFAWMKADGVSRVPGTAVFLTRTRTGTPPMLIHHIEHNRVLHAQTLILTVRTMPIPRIGARNRLSVESLGEGCYRVEARYGFMQTPAVPVILKACGRFGVHVDPDKATYYLSHETVLRAKEGSEMSELGLALYSYMSRNATRVTEFFNIPQDRVMEIGIHVEI